MPRRGFTIPVAWGVAGVLALAGCTSGAPYAATGATDTPGSSLAETAPTAPTPTDTAADRAALDAVTVTGDVGSEPTLQFATPFAVSSQVVRTIDTGTGAALEPGQRLSLAYVIYSGADGARSWSTWNEGGGETDAFVLGDSAYGGVNTSLAGQHVGARVLLASPVTDSTTGQTESQIMLLEVTEAATIPTRAQGTPVAPVPGLPTVTLGATGKPSITIPAGYAPSALVVQPLITGTGRAVTAEDTLTVHYAGWLLDGTQFDSSWDRGGATVFPLANMIQGWIDALPGMTVGSQVLLVVPPALAYGTAAEGSTSQYADQTLVFVVDLLDAQVPPGPPALGPPAPSATNS